MKVMPKYEVAPMTPFTQLRICWSAEVYLVPLSWPENDCDMSLITIVLNALPEP